jgi:hypothetical protein
LFFIFHTPRGIQLHLFVIFHTHRVLQLHLFVIFHTPRVIQLHLSVIVHTPRIIQLHLSEKQNSVLWNFVLLYYISNGKPLMDRQESSLRFIPSSNFIIGVNYKTEQYFMADTI